MQISETYSFLLKEVSAWRVQTAHSRGVQCNCAG